MGDLSKIGRTARHEITIEAPPHWMDHHFQGRAILPAVEAMQLLAHQVLGEHMAPGVHTLRAARFDKFLPLPQENNKITAFFDVTPLEGGLLRAALATRVTAKTAKISRTVVHAQLDFKSVDEEPPACPLDLAAALEGCSFQVTPDRIYAELVPFGAAYRNIVEPIHLTQEGALAALQAPQLVDGQTTQPLGAPFVLDAAFHAACVWSQRYMGVVAFPVGIEQRFVLRPTRTGEPYIARIFPKATDQPLLHFDIWIMDPDGRLCEVLIGVQMRDVSGGRLQPPDWIRCTELKSVNDHLFADCAAATIMERSTIMPFAGTCLSDRERERMGAMGERRRNGYLAARLACKRLARKLSGNDDLTSPRDISTLDEGSVRPFCPVTDGSGRYECSVSHYSRFVVAVAASSPLGVDVERLSARILKAPHLFMSEREQELLKQSKLDQVRAAMQIWSIKEAVAKALNISLADAWEQTEVVEIGGEESHCRLRGEVPCLAFHGQIEDHLITVMTTLVPPANQLK